MSDTFTRHRFEWLERIAADGKVPPSALRVAFFISKHINRGSGDAWPSLQRLAAETSLPERTVGYAIKALCDLGHLEKRRSGFGKSNRYSMAGNSPGGGGEQPVSNLAMDCRNDGSSSAMGCQNEPPNLAMDCHSFWQPVAIQSGNGLPSNPLNESFEREPSEEDRYPPPPAPKPAKAKAKAKVEDERFEAFWAAYPKKVARADAVRAWGKALKAADADTLIAGAIRYAAEQHGKDPTYIKHPATWLNKGCWTDEPAPPPTPSAPAPRGGLTAKDRTAAAVAAVLAQVGGGDHEL